MGDKWSTHPNGVELYFNEEAHTYTLGEDYLISATTIVHEYFPEFDEDRHSARVAQRDNVDQSVILAEWEKTRNDACTFGTNVHNFCEMYLLEEELPEPLNNKEKFYFQTAKRFINQLKEDYEIVTAEQMVFSPRFKIAGTVDLVARNRKTGKFAILDWKTNKEIKETNPYREGVWGFNPCEKLHNCNYWHYALQLNLYRTLLWVEDYYDCEDAEMAFFHIGLTGVKRYDLERLDREITHILLKNMERKYDPTEH